LPRVPRPGDWKFAAGNGIATEDDSRRIEYIKRAIASVQKCIEDKIDVRGYMLWRLRDNCEW
jgi:beta-glucosidase